MNWINTLRYKLANWISPTAMMYPAFAIDQPPVIADTRRVEKVTGIVSLRADPLAYRRGTIDIPPHIIYREKRRVAGEMGKSMLEAKMFDLRPRYDDQGGRWECHMIARIVVP